MGTLVPKNANLVLYGSQGEVAEGAARLQRVGYSARVMTPEAWTRAACPWPKARV